MSSFGSRRKPRKIVADEPDETAQNSIYQPPATTTTFSKFTKRPLKHSSLRKSINITDDSQAFDEPDSTGPVVIKPSTPRPGSLRRKKKTGSRLSFGPGEVDVTEDDDVVLIPKKSGLGLQAIANSARNLPVRTAFAGDDDGPRYSKESLAELQSSTPNTPIRTPESELDVDAIELDESELEGAMVVEASSLPFSFAVSGPSEEGTRILTHAEIEEKKARRHKLALVGDSGEGEDDYISLDDRPKKKSDTRLVPEDEDLGEGFDDFVEDGGIMLSKKAEREARRRQRKEMAELINEAEDDSESDSEAERIAAFENAQTRAGMEGLKQLDPTTSSPSPYYNYQQFATPKLTPIPDVSECLARFRATLVAMEEDVKARETRLTESRAELVEIEERQEELQRKLVESGETYRKLLGGLMGETGGGMGDTPSGGGGGGGLEGSPLARFGLGFPEQRGLESFGNTPIRIPGEEDGGEDKEMGGT